MQFIDASGPPKTSSKAWMNAVCSVHGRELAGLRTKSGEIGTFAQTVSRGIPRSSRTEIGTPIILHEIRTCSRRVLLIMPLGLTSRHGRRRQELQRLVVVLRPAQAPIGFEEHHGLAVAVLETARVL